MKKKKKEYEFPDEMREWVGSYYGIPECLPKIEAPVKNVFLVIKDMESDLPDYVRKANHILLKK